MFEQCSSWKGLSRKEDGADEWNQKQDKIYQFFDHIFIS